MVWTILDRFLPSDSRKLVFEKKGAEKKEKKEDEAVGPKKPGKLGKSVVPKIFACSSHAFKDSPTNHILK